ncbi:hypothetical protein J4Q44_G00091030, partial [Coregonus suidteri]
KTELKLYYLLGISKALLFFLDLLCADTSQTVNQKVTCKVILDRPSHYNQGSHCFCSVCLHHI